MFSLVLNRCYLMMLMSSINDTFRTYKNIFACFTHISKIMIIMLGTISINYLRMEILALRMYSMFMNYGGGFLFLLN